MSDAPLGFIAKKRVFGQCCTLSCNASASSQCTTARTQLSSALTVPWHCSWSLSAQPCSDTTLGELHNNSKWAGLFPAPQGSVGMSGEHVTTGVQASGWLVPNLLFSSPATSRYLPFLYVVPVLPAAYVITTWL